MFTYRNELAARYLSYGISAIRDKSGSALFYFKQAMKYSKKSLRKITNFYLGEAYRLDGNYNYALMHYEEAIKPPKQVVSA